MTSDDIKARLTELERALANRRRVDFLVRAFLILAGLAFSILVAWQLWLVNDHLSRQRAHQLEHQFWLICHSGASPQERTDAFVQLVEAKNNEWRGARLEGLQLKGVTLDGAILPFCQFDSTDFSHASLVRANLDQADLRLVDLTKADLGGAILSGATLLKAKLNEANLRGAKLQSAVLQQAQLCSAELGLADLSDANLIMADLSGANLTGTVLAGAKLDAAILRGANLTLANLAGARLANTDLTDSTWWKSRGLSASQIAEFRETFVPTSAASESRKRDYQLWLGQFELETASETAIDID